MGDIVASDKVVKHSADDFVVTFNCTNLLTLSGETVTGTPTIDQETDHATSSLTIGTATVNTSAVTVDGTEIATGKAIQVRVSGGTSKADHTLKCTFSTSGSNTKVTKAVINVRDN